MASLVSVLRKLGFDKMARLGAIVMPTATGKSYILSDSSASGIVEADSICKPRESEKLSNLRDHAKVFNDWSPYDCELAREIRSRLPDEPVVILLASQYLAIALDAEILTFAVLDKGLWVENMESRCLPIEKHIDCYMDAYSSCERVFKTREELADHVLQTAEQFHARVEKK